MISMLQLTDVKKVTHDLNINVILCQMPPSTINGTYCYGRLKNLQKMKKNRSKH